MKPCQKKSLFCPSTTDVNAAHRGSRYISICDQMNFMDSYTSVDSLAHYICRLWIQDLHFVEQVCLALTTLKRLQMNRRGITHNL